MVKKNNPLNRLRQAIYFVLLFSIFSVSRSSAAQDDFSFSGQEWQSAAGYQTYLPYLTAPPIFTSDKSIWVHNRTPASHEIGLFRYEFSLENALNEVEFQIFADSRYEAWLDGQWVGRGPARFSRTYRQYDIYHLGQLTAGDHTLAILVQWAPNQRRSESLRPYLQAHLQGRSAQGFEIFARSGPGWKSLLTDAWRQDAALVHSWNLIGPTELRDFRLLSDEWILSDFNDEAWQPAVEVGMWDLLPDETINYIIDNESASRQIEIFSQLAAGEYIQYEPRSISMLVEAPITPTLIDRGSLSSAYLLGEVNKTVGENRFNFDVQRTTVFSIETLVFDPMPILVIDNQSSSWALASPERPDVRVVTTTLPAGSHWLSFSGIPYSPTFFQVSKESVSFPPLSISQGDHAGRCLLLSQPTQQLEKVNVLSELPLSLEFTEGAAYVVLDLGRVSIGRLYAEVSGPAGSLIDIGWDERLFPGTTRPLPYPGSLHPEWNQVDSWVLDGTDQRRLTTIDARTGRYILIAVWGSGKIRLENIRVFEERYPVTQRGYFDSSNELLDRIWETGIQTALSNMTDAYSDPWRERGQWWGDAYVLDHVNRAAFGETDLLRRGIVLMAKEFSHATAPGLAPHGDGLNMLDYSMLWVHSLAEYVELTGDLSLVRDVYPVLQQFMEHLSTYKNPETGLLDLPLLHWSQTAYIDALGYHNRYGQSTALNSIYYQTLVNAADIAASLNLVTDAQRWKNEADTISEQVNQQLYLPSEQRYLTNIYQGQPYFPTSYSQAWPLAYELTPEENIEAVVSALLELLSSDPAAPNIQIYGMYWVFEALGRSGHIAEAIDIMKLYYGRMLDLGATTWWESFLANQSYTSALSHGWGGSPTWFLSTYVLGARQTGVNSWSVEPPWEGISSVEGAIPLPQGDLQVSWSMEPCVEKYLHIVAPIDTQGVVTISVNAFDDRIILNDQLIWQNDARSLVTKDGKGDPIVFNLAAGTYDFVVRQDCSQNDSSASPDPALSR